MREEGDTADVKVAAIAARQHGVVSFAQLLAVGLKRSAVARRASAGRLHRVHRGVYAVGHPALSLEGRWMAAVLAVGSGAALSHASAAALWKLLRPIAGPIDVSVPSSAGRRSREGLRIHRARSLAGDSRLVVIRHRIPVTGPCRTIEDLRGRLPERLVRRATRQAEILGLLGAESSGDRSRSDLERDFLGLCRGYRIPPPEVNVPIGRWTVDFLWRGARLVVETDSYAYHRGRIAFQDDRARDLDLRGRGFDVIRVSERQLNDEPATVAAVIEGMLARGSAS
jgi:Transcriptional regulator, AbiEi antitoxin/Protein of unknown function (DUF559)